jgi:hypothetical protein
VSCFTLSHLGYWSIGLDHDRSRERLVLVEPRGVGLVMLTPPPSATTRVADHAERQAAVALIAMGDRGRRWPLPQGEPKPTGKPVKPPKLGLLDGKGLTEGVTGSPDSLPG